MENKRYLSSFALLLAIIMCLSACGPVLYTGVGQNVPLFQKKGEIAVSAGFSQVQTEPPVLSHDFAAGFNTQVAAAIGDHTAVMASYYRLNGSGEWSGNGDYIELGIGRFKYNETKRLASEIFIGTGWGSIRNSMDGSHVNVKYFKPFIQPSVGFSSPHFEIAFTPRIALVSYTSKSEKLVASDYDFQNFLDDFWSEKRNSVVFEPGVTLRAGMRKVKLQLQYTYTSFNFNEFDGYSPVYKNYVSFGLFVLVCRR